MRAIRNFWVWAAIVGVCSPAISHAQIGSYSRPQTNTRPTVSPYLNLNRGGNAAINYYGIVRPQVETQRNFAQIEQGTFGMGMDPRFSQAGTPGVGPDGNPIGNGQFYRDPTTELQTGHPAMFNNTSHYFPNPRAGGAGGAGGGPTVSSAASGFGRPSASSTPFYIGTGNGLIMPVNPGGANPLGTQIMNQQPQVPGQVVNP